ncbi:MAG: serine/threonine-protein kinase [Pirellula sp.]
MQQGEHGKKDETLFDRLSLTAKVKVNRLCDEFELLLQKNPNADLKEFVKRLSQEEIEAAFRELIDVDLSYRIRNNCSWDDQYYLDRFPKLDRAWLIERAKILTDGNAELSPQLANPISNGQLGDYTILGPLGSGGMGQVFRAEHRLMGRQVAIKFLKDSSLKDPSSKLRFEREVRTISKLNHANIVSAYDAREEAGMLFLVTELIDGEDLSNLVRRKGPLKPKDAMYYVWQAAKGLKYAHEQGIIHRDVKPSNLLLEKKKTVKVLDLGLARLMEAEHPTNSNQQAITSTTHIVGTAAFMSPEQAKTPYAVDERSDIYSLGCTLYFLMTGKPPYIAKSEMETILAHLNDPIPDLRIPVGSPPASAELNLLLRRMLSKSPQDRPASMGQVVEKLASLIKAEQSDATHLFQAIERHSPSTNRRRPSGWARRQWLLAGMAGASAVVIPLAWYNIYGDRPEPLRVSPTWDDGIRFDGVRSFVRVPIQNEQVGYSFSMEVAAIANPHTMPSNLMTFSGPRCMAIFLANHCWGVAHFDGNRSKLVVSDSHVQYGQRVIVGAQWKDSELVLTLDGKRIATNEIEYPMQAGPKELYIGGIPVGVIPAEQGLRFFDGTIVAARIQSGKLQPMARNLDELFRVDQSTLAMFPMTERAGKFCNDVGPRQLRGELIQAIWNRPN